MSNPMSSTVQWCLDESKIMMMGLKYNANYVAYILAYFKFLVAVYSVSKDAR